MGKVIGSIKTIYFENSDICHGEYRIKILMESFNKK